MNHAASNSGLAVVFQFLAVNGVILLQRGATFAYYYVQQTLGDDLVTLGVAMFLQWKGLCQIEFWAPKWLVRRHEVVQ